MFLKVFIDRIRFNQFVVGSRFNQLVGFYLRPAYTVVEFVPIVANGCDGITQVKEIFFPLNDYIAYNSKNTAQIVLRFGAIERAVGKAN